MREIKSLIHINNMIFMDWDELTPTDMMKLKLWKFIPMEGGYENIHRYMESGFSKDTMIYGKKISAENIRRVIRKITWTQGDRYEIYRQDYSTDNQSPLTNSSRLYDANYYVLNKDFNVYVCLNNGSSGINTTGNRSQNEPLFTGLEPSAADGASNDG